MHKRDVKLDVAKGIGIVLMVIGHTGCPNWLHSSIYSFHMPLFFIISGLCIGGDKISGAYREYFYNKVRRLYLPFIQYGLFFYFFDQLRMLICEDNHSLDIVSLVRDIALIFAMIQTPQLIACYWFITALFISSIFAVLVLKVSKIYMPRYQWLIVPIMLMIMLLLFKYNFHISILLSYKTVYYTTLILLGYHMKMAIRYMNKYNLPLLGVMCVFICSATFILFDMSSTPDSPLKLLLRFLLSTIGSLGVIIISSYLVKHAKHISKFLTYIGGRTMDILTWHFSALRLMNIFVVLLFALPKDQLAEFPCISSDPYYWIFFVPASIIISLIIGNIIERVKQIIKYEFTQKSRQADL